MKKVYLDNAATTPVRKEVVEAMRPYFNRIYANPSSFHMAGKEASDAVQEARKTIAGIIGARPQEIYFCSGGTESDNMAILGAARFYKRSGNHIITTRIEHHAVLEPIHHLEFSEGFKGTYIGVGENGVVDPREIEKALTSNTILVSVMMANNEVGTIQPIAEIGKIILKWRKKNNTQFPLFHTDACQAAGALDIDVRKLHVDFLTLNGSKIYGPKGAGVLFVREGARIDPLLRGGAQERGLRPGTENVPAIVGLGRALELAQKEREKENARLIRLRDWFAGEILKKVPGTYLNGDSEKRLPNNVNISFLNCEGEALMLYLDAKGIFVSTGSACTSQTLDPSHVLLAMGLPPEAAHGSVRFTLGRETTRDDLKYVLRVLPEIVKKLRDISPTQFEYGKK